MEEERQYLDGASNLINTEVAARCPRKRKTLIILCSAIGAIVVGVVIAIIILNINGTFESWFSAGNTSSCKAETEEERAQKAVDIENVVFDVNTAIDSMSFDEALFYIDGKIVEYEGTDYEFSMRMAKVYLLFNEGDAEAAYEESKMIQTDSVSETNLLEYYTAMINIAKGLDDSEMTDKYQTLLSEVIQEMNVELE